MKDVKIVRLDNGKNISSCKAEPEYGGWIRLDNGKNISG